MSSIYPSSTSTSSANSSSKLLRISGMASGIDTDAVVKSMVSNYQSKIDKANQAKQTVQWQQEAYRGIITGIKGLQDYFDPLSSKYMMSGNSFNTNSVTNSDSAIVSATVSSSAKTGNYKVSVQQLAEQAKIEGDSRNSMIQVSNLSKWSEVKLDFGSDSITLGSIAGGTEINATSMSNLAADINSKLASTSLNGKISASYVNDGTNSYIKYTKSASADSVTLAANTTLGTTATTINSGISSASKLSDLGISDNISFSLAYDTATNTTPVSITANSNSTIKDLMDKVNSATGGAVTMSIDNTTGKISFQSKNYGSSSCITIKDQSSGVSNLSNIGITIAKNDTGKTGAGKDAIVSITEPGQTKASTTTQSSNQFTINGVSYNLTGVNESGKTSNVNVTSNSDTVVSNVKKFIEDYNTIISTINTKLTEKKNTAYAPLTDAQRESMSDTQITTWESKAKVGILRKDDYLSSLMTQLRGTLYSPVYSSYDSTDTSTGKVALTFGSYGTGAIGIETSEDLTDGGKIVIKDEEKLKNAIENNMDDFKKLFIGSSSSTLDSNKTYIGSKEYSEDGIFKRMDNIIRDYVASPGIGKDGTYTTAGYMNLFVNKQYDFSSSGSSGKNTLPDQVYSKTLSVSKYQTQLNDASTRYYAKFTALETAMNKLNAQQSSLASMLGTSS
ncbi:flagellar filament capping protein FliD [Clostridium estertheticum]|uniref:flagellar filament capping protein FliD n=1 Tax=Clostridium estertheticum TaxID=238834 RepID=UPI001CF2D5C9|nr:flagellar filament capping protein FliD [Clostridium estertheticum]MCB2308797.1 flagellar filament capping protein FliD [Clostridium estertheticum]MCB2347125.1 flagellar filament capping protein FliD [Clostridium estertheticum]MCB2351783.1 flagellar filament capping protein FliD [Clostridium estertheticum]WAG44495.1 flagellar filament capping protein FliD [Clostridium estertheticum]